MKYKDILRSMDPKPVEIWLGITAFIWGAWLIVAIDLYNLPAYKFMAALMPDTYWAILGMSLGVTKILIACKGTITAERYATFAGTFFWGLLTFGTLYNVTITLAPAVFLSLALASAWAYLSLAFWRHNE